VAGMEHVFKVLVGGEYSYIAELERKLIKSYRDTGECINYMDGGEHPSGIPGEDHWNSSLTEDTVVLIRELYSSGKYTGRSLSTMFNTGYKNISKIVRGERWKSVGGPLTLVRQDISKVANRAKLSEEEVPIVRETAKILWERGCLSIPELANELDIARQNLRRVLLGEVWAELGGPLLRIDYYKEFGRNG
jgi:hypothetical protein